MKPRLLLVEDDLVLQETLSDALDGIGFDVVVACSGAQALAALDAEGTHFEEVITDIDLGEGPDGWDVGRRARERAADMPVIYISGNSSKEWPSQGVENSVFIAKPFSLTQFGTALMTLLEASAEAEPPER